MNVENLNKMVEYLGNVTDKQMDMAVYNKAYSEMPKYGKENLIEDNFSCKTAGCVIGHCIVLDTNLAKELIAQHSIKITYMIWSEKFTGIRFFSEEWEWCFSSDWCKVDNTIDGAISRMEALINGTHKQHKDYEIFLDYVYQY